MLNSFVKEVEREECTRTDSNLIKLTLNLLLVGAQFGTVISMPLSGLLSASTAGWPSIFYVFGAVGAVWCIAFLVFVHEDPGASPKMSIDEKKYIQKALGNVAGAPVRIIYIYYFDIFY